MNQITTPLDTIPTTKTLGILLFPDFETLDVFGPLEMFGLLKDKIKIVLISEKSGTVHSAQGTHVIVDTDLKGAPDLDILLVPGGPGTRREVFNSNLLNWIKSKTTSTKLVLSVCTGSALLAKSGVLDNHKATSNKLALDWVMEQSTKVDWIKRARWVDDNNIITSSGISAGIDMSLYVIAKLYGEEVKNHIAKLAEYVFNDDPNNDKFANDS